MICLYIVKCPEDFVACLDGSGCVRRDWLCDSEPDCDDASDEEADFCTSGRLNSFIKWSRGNAARSLID